MAAVSVRAPKGPHRTPHKITESHCRFLSCLWPGIWIEQRAHTLHGELFVSQKPAQRKLGTSYINLLVHCFVEVHVMDYIQFRFNWAVPEGEAFFSPNPCNSAVKQPSAEALALNGCLFYIIDLRCI